MKITSELGADYTLEIGTIETKDNLTSIGVTESIDGVVEDDIYAYLSDNSLKLLYEHIGEILKEKEV